MHEETGFQVVAQGAFPNLREMQLALRAAGFEAEVVHPPEGKGSS